MNCHHFLRTPLGFCLLFICVFGIFSGVRQADAEPGFLINVAFDRGLTLTLSMTTRDPCVLTVFAGKAKVDILVKPDAATLFQTAIPDVHFEFLPATTTPVILTLADLAAVEPGTPIPLPEFDLPPEQFEFAVVDNATGDVLDLLTPEQPEISIPIARVFAKTEANGSSIPEPATLLLLGLGVIGLIKIVRRTANSTK